MLYKNGHETTGVYINDRAISTIYKGTRIVWQAIRSCFGRGYWVPAKPWLGADAWKY